MRLSLGLIIATICLFPSSLFACLGGTNSGTITPTTAYQTQAISNGQYFVVNVTCGNTYNFTFCGNGGTASWDTQLTVIDNTGTTELAYNDDFCSLQSDVTWTSTFTGTVQILASLYFCNNDGSSNGVLAYNMTVGSTNASFTLQGVCGGLSTTITGDTGGSFSWNPSDPGDGSILNTSTGQITGGIPGTSYTLDYTVCASTSTQSATVPPGDCWTLNGVATYVTIGGEQCIQLTPELNNQTGCAWNGSQIDFSLPFTLSLDYYFGNNINGADGNTFTFQPSSSSACGTNGGQLGAGGLANALSIEFDTYDNDNPAHIYDMSCDHIAVEIDGNMQGPGAPLCGPVCAKAGGGNIDDGGIYQVDISWNPVTLQLDIYFDGVLRLSCSHDFITNVFGTNSVYWGVTSATGGLNNQQYFCPSTVVLPTSIGSFTSYCDGEIELIEWQTISEDNVSHFVIESTIDGLLFEPIGTVEAMGNTQSTTTYGLEFSSETSSKRLYRLKMVDLDGAYEYSTLILSKNCGEKESSIFSRLITESDAIRIGLNEPATCTLYNQLGQLVFTQNNVENEVIIATNKFPSGIYILHADNGRGKVEVERIFVK
ncbi:MAG: hypothetical protein COA38_12625 [Fluviicola sp.]|nr:MAG: hypothetical protein COA38_12625 [Fluviicola sp.]